EFATSTKKTSGRLVSDLRRRKRNLQQNCQRRNLKVMKGRVYDASDARREGTSRQTVLKVEVSLRRGNPPRWTHGPSLLDSATSHHPCHQTYQLSRPLSVIQCAFAVASIQAPTRRS